MENPRELAFIYIEDPLEYSHHAWQKRFKQLLKAENAKIDEVGAAAATLSLHLKNLLPDNNDAQKQLREILPKLIPAAHFFSQIQREELQTAQPCSEEQ